ncbi:MAG TPA: YggS family pyridoxal phosphate-dependent enzyme [Acidimicrobiales bacterium]|nr:YggS family pyridoxal phosphate-dependent enzyme [Acidimicrobiales bacterium]
MTVAEAVAGLRRQMAEAGADPDRVRVVAVTKGQPFEAVAEAAGAGLVDLGENYAQELLAKAARATEAGLAGLRWHFLGAVQRNKVADLAPVVWLWQSVDRAEEAGAIARSAPGARVLVQVAIAPGPGRGGCAPEEAAGLVEASRRLGLDPLGLMAVGAPDDPGTTADGFRWLAAEASRLGLPEVSMGMSEDFRSAVQAGSTMVRIGRALFGPRPGAVGLRR